MGRARRIAAVNARLPQPARATLPALEAAESVFEQARSKGEYPGGSGSGSVGFALDEQNKMREQLVIHLQHFSIDLEHCSLDLEYFSIGKVPRVSRRTGNRRSSSWPQSSRQPSYPARPQRPLRRANGPGLMATEAAWQKRVAQWMALIPIAYPTLSQDAAATELLRLRIHQVKKAPY